MKLKEGFIAQDIDDTQYLVPIGAEAFNGIARSNKTAAFIVDCLREDTTEKAIVDAMCAKFAADRDTIAADVEAFLDTLRHINAIE